MGVAEAADERARRCSVFRTACSVLCERIKMLGADYCQMPHRSWWSACVAIPFKWRAVWTACADREGPSGVSITEF